MNDHKTIGIIGGQGPDSTADFYLRIIRYYERHLGATRIKDYPPMVILSVPGPDLISGVENEELTYELLAAAVSKLERADCQFIVIACNSTQFLNERLQQLVSIPIIGIADVATKFVHEKDYKTVGILATNTTIIKRIYADPLEKIGIKVVTPNDDDQIIVERVIQNENAGDINAADKQKLLAVIDKLQAAGAETVFLACTELPLLIKQADTTVPLVDCNELYAVEAAKLSA